MSSEEQILNLIRKLTPNSKKYLHDDGAIIEGSWVLTTDSLVENTHFTLKKYTPREIGWKAMAVNLSDIAAMGGRPLYVLISLILPKYVTIGWIKDLYKGLITCAKKYKTKIVGGNLARGEKINITVTILGKMLTKKTGKRSNAKPQDLVFVSGVFGNPIKKPKPQITLGQEIVKLTKRAALMDSSDGLADCLIQIANESRTKIVVDEEKIPKSKHSTYDALYKGEDYELVGTASKTDCRKLRRIKIIGKVFRGKGAYLRQKGRKVVKLNMKNTYAHFK